jgi:hypothetical protein
MGTFAEAAIVDCRLSFLPTKENKVHFLIPYAANKRKFAVFVFCFQKTNGSCRFSLVPFSTCGILKTWRHQDINTPRLKDITQKTKNGPGDFP